MGCGIIRNGDDEKESYRRGFAEGFRWAIKKYAGTWVVGEDGKTLNEALEEARKEENV